MKALTLAAVALCALAAPAHAAGRLAADAGPLRNAWTGVQVVVDGDVARTTVTQVFVNDLDTPVEVTYSFPLPEDAAVTGFADWRDGRRLEAGVEGREEAADAYEEAAAEGRPAALAETEGPSRFRLRLSTVPPRGSRRVELTYVQTLSALGGERTWVFPGERAGEAPPPTVLDVGVTLLSDRPIRAVEVPNQPDARVLATGADRREVLLSRTGTGLGADLAVRWRVQTADLDLATRAVRPHADQPGYLEVRFALNGDPFDHLRPAQDVVLVLDTSLSMAGDPLERGRVLLEGVLAELHAEDRVHLVTFGTAVHQPFPGLQPADDGVLGLALSWLDEVRAGGRSNLQAALDAAAEVLRDSPGATVVLVTDGQPTLGAGFERLPLHVDPYDWEPHRVLIAHANYPTRQAALEALFPSVSTRYLPDGEAGLLAVEDLIRLAVAPALEGLDLRIVGPGVYSVEGAVPPRLAVGEHVRLLARVPAGALVLVTGRLHGQPVFLQDLVAVPAGPDGRGDRGLPVEWARLRVRGLEAQLDAGDLEADEAEAVAAEVRSLGEGYRLATRFTSYVLTDSLAPDRIKPGDPEIRIHASGDALGVRAVLPWGEVVTCHWQEDEGLWLGRFLVPRGTPDGMYRMRVFVDGQEGTAYRGTLFFRVDSRPPDFELLRAGDGPVASGARVRLFARPVEDVFEGAVVGAHGDTVVRDRVDLKRIVVQVGDREVPLTRTGTGELWEAEIALDLPPGTHVLRLVATDYALNSAEATLSVEVTP